MLKFISTIILMAYTLSPAMAIIDGIPLASTETQYAYKVRFKQGWKTGMPCTATVISKYSVLTAAHCVDKLNSNRNTLLLIYGYKRRIEKIITPDDFKIHIAKFYEYLKSEDWDNQTYYHKLVALNDIAIINLKRSLPKKLNQIKLSFDTGVRNDAVLAMGLGFTKYNQETKKYYQKTNIPYYRNQNLAFVTIESEFIYYLPSKEKDEFITAPGDSGGPLILKGNSTQIGILRGILFNADNTNGSLYTPIYRHKDFISKNAKGYKRDGL